MSRCDGILQDGIFNTLVVDTATSSSETLYEWLKTATFEQIKSAQEAGLEIILPIEGVPMGIDGSFSEQEYREWREYVDSGRIRTFTETEFSNIVSRSADQGIVKAWKDCILGTGNGLLAYEDWDENGLDGSFTLTFRYGADELGDSYPVVQSFQLLGATSSMPLQPGSEIPYAGVSVICERPRDDQGGYSAARYVLNTNKGAVDGSIQAVLTNQTPKIRGVSIFSSTSPVASHPTASVTVPSGYKLIGGGARINWRGFGNLLTASYPSSIDTWTVEAKDHGGGDPSTADAFAIAIFDPDDEWEVVIDRAVSDRSQFPTETVSARVGFQLVGGGAKANWVSAGMLLTASHPVGSNAWLAKSKDHQVPEANTLEVYAISLRPRNGSEAPPVVLQVDETSVAAHPTGRCQLAGDIKLIGGGAIVNYVGPGNLLTASYPDAEGWVAASKQHEYENPSSISVYAIGISTQYFS